jgi:hypothetical protein
MNLELKTTTLGGRLSFLDSEKVRYVRGGITLDHLTVAPDPLTGLKRIAAGTVVGRLGNGKYSPYVAGAAAVPGVASTVTLKASGTGARDDIVITAKQTGADGDKIKIQLVNPDAASASLKIAVETDVIRVYLATDGTKAITSTIAEVIAAINATLYVKDIVTALLAGGSEGTDAAIAVAATALAGGVDDTPAGAPNVTPRFLLADDVVFTTFTATGGAVHGDQLVTAIDQARVIEARLPAAIDALTKASMPGITWV